MRQVVFKESVAAMPVSAIAATIEIALNVFAADIENNKTQRRKAMLVRDALKYEDEPVAAEKAGG